MGSLTEEDDSSALQAFQGELANFVRVQAAESLVARADTLAWEPGLPGHDAVQSVSALLWQDSMDQEVSLAWQGLLHGWIAGSSASFAASLILC